MIEVCEYSPQWKTNFESLKNKIWPVVSDYADRMEHVGSTAVEGLWAKPVIDLDIVVKSKESLPGVIKGLASIGYTHRGNLGIEGREAFRCENPNFKHNLYACIEGCLAYRNHIVLRDHLRSHPADRDKYSEIKRTLAREFADDIDSYVDGKTDFILSILRRYQIEGDDLSSIEKANKKPKEFETERLILRGWKDSDSEPFYQMNCDPQVIEFLPKALTREENDLLIERIRKGISENGFGLWAVEIKESGDFIGFVGLSIPTFTAPFTPCVEVGWRLAHKYWGKGYATEAARRAVSLGFKEFDLDEILSFTVPMNKRSISVMERLGMTRNPNEDFNHPKLEKGHRLERHVLYRLTKARWENQI